MRCLVTGGTGFIGSNLVRALVKMDCEVWATGLYTENPLPEGVQLFDHGICGVDWSRINRLIGRAGFDILFHQAANNDTTIADTEAIFWANVHSSMVMFEKVRSLGCKKIIFASSTAVYGNQPAPYREDSVLKPLNNYALSKECVEQMAMHSKQRTEGMMFVGLRYCNVYGPGESHKGPRASMVYKLAQQIKKGPPRLFGDGEQRRDYVYIDDVVRANLLAMQMNESGIFNVGTGEATTYNDLVSILRLTIKEDLGVPEWDKPTYIKNPYGDAYQTYTECDMTLAAEKLGFVPKYGIRKGIARYHECGGI